MYDSLTMELRLCCFFRSCFVKYGEIMKRLALRIFFPPEWFYDVLFYLKTYINEMRWLSEISCDRTKILISILTAVFF